MPAPASDQATVAFIYKRRYSDRQATEVAMREHPDFYDIAKEGSFDGSDFAYPITTGNPQGISSGFPSARTAAEALKGAQLIAVPKTKYGVITLDGIAMLKARGSKGSFYDFVTRHSDGILDELGANLAFDLERDGTGLRGRIASISGNRITLTSQRDVENFKRGMTLVASQNANGNTLKSGTMKVVKLLRSLKQIQVDDASQIQNLAANDNLFRLGDPGQCMEGKENCTPLASPVPGDNFRNIDRSDDVEALAGSRIDEPGRYPEDTIGDLAVECSIIGKKVTRASVYPTVFQAMVKRLGAKVIYTNPGGAVDIGFESLLLHSAGGAVKVTSNPDCRPDRVRVARPDAHCIKHIDELVHIIRDDGRPSLRSTENDGIEIRARSVHNYVQYDPASHGVGSTRFS